MRPGAAPLTPRAPRVLAARRLRRRRERDETGLFLVEGPQAVREAAGHVVEVFATDRALRQHAATIRAVGRQRAQRSGAHGQAAGIDGRAARDAPVTPVTEAALAALSETVSPQGLVAVCRRLDVGLDVALARAPGLVAVLVEVRDPGNAGTVLRTADAAGAGAVVFAGAAVDPYNGKCVRASAGSLFHVDVVRAPDPLAAVATLRSAGLSVLAADGHGETDLYAAPLHRPTAWLFGSEAHGLPAAAAATADARVRVPIHGRAESLNLAAAAAVCLYASARAHRVEEPPR